ncbi:hypothetical protein Nmel_000149 [Mimus melanotis]
MNKRNSQNNSSYWTKKKNTKARKMQKKSIFLTPIRLPLPQELFQLQREPINPLNQGCSSQKAGVVDTSLSLPAEEWVKRSTHGKSIQLCATFRKESAIQPRSCLKTFEKFTDGYSSNPPSYLPWASFRVCVFGSWLPTFQPSYKIHG